MGPGRTMSEMAALDDSTTDHDFPSARHLASLHGFFKSASFNRDGSANLTFLIPSEVKNKILDISDNDGMALNISVWETRLVEDSDDWLAEILGIEIGGATLPETVVLKKKVAEVSGVED